MSEDLTEPLKQYSKPDLAIVIAGPTASGKSDLAVDLAVKLGGVVINADSMQIYVDTPIIAAAPKEEDLVKVPHYLYGVFPASKNGSVVDWLELAIAQIKRAWSDKKVPIIVGGTGFYIDALVYGLTPIPETGDAVRRQVSVFMNEKGVNAMHDELKDFDPVSYATIKANDTTRVRRAWEVYLDTGTTMSEWQSRPKVRQLDADFLVIKLLPPTKELDERCYVRFDKMIEQGGLDEVKKLYSKKLDENLPAMKALGVPELMSYLKGERSLEEAADLAKLHSRQYAKRQKTWFRNKLEADVTLEECYKRQEDILDGIIGLV
ncbi:MAG: tRNA (adenosine(37)-N6)-dimethylallyltransferase MiaA [Lactobacillus sp.]|nr:tRNA (adenosine(37)-N6)-dimethylallyltransferase MiaA [Lactobacillus sp.]